MYLNPLRSNIALVPKIGKAIINPANVPCKAPCLKVRKLFPYLDINSVNIIPISDVGSFIPGSFAKRE